MGSMKESETEGQIIPDGGGLDVRKSSKEIHGGQLTSYSHEEIPVKISEVPEGREVIGFEGGQRLNSSHKGH